MRKFDYEISMPEDRGIRYEQFQYPAGEYQVRLTDKAISRVKKAKRIKVEAFIQDGNPMPLLLLLDAIRGVNLIVDVTLRLPYLPYARADRRFVEGDCFGLEVFGKVLKIFDIGMPTQVQTIDVHSLVAEKKIWQLRNGDPTQLIAQAIRKIGRKSLTLVLPDKGAARYDLKPFKLPIVQAEKLRDPKTGKLSGFKVPEIETEKALIVDDICDGGGTFIGIAEAINKPISFTPRKKLYLYVTHGIFSQGTEKLNRHFSQIFYSDTFKGEQK